MVSNDIFEEKYLHRGGKVTDCRLFGAFPSEGAIEFCLRAHRSAGLAGAVLLVHSDGLSERGEAELSYPLEFKETGVYDTLSVLVPISRLSELSAEGLFYYSYRVSCFAGELSLGGEEVSLLMPTVAAGERQLLIYKADFKTPEFLHGASVYHIFVDRFKSSGRCALKEGAVFNPDWEGGCPMYPEYRGAPLKNNEFFGGDLWGIIEKLDFLEALGITVLYLSPVFESVSNHKYDTSDYMKVDSMFGGDEALSALIKECGERGMRVILDGVFNHTGDDSIYFDRYHRYKDGACDSKNSPYYPWYTFKSYPDSYECWWGIDILPRVNSSDKSYMDFIFGACGVVEKWLGEGVSGFRLDVADELGDDFLNGLRKAVSTHGGALIGEVWEDASNKVAYGRRRHYFSGGQLDSVMNYPLREAVISFIKEGDAERLRSVCEGIYRRYPKCVSDSLMNFLGTHDTERILTVLVGESAEGRTMSELASMKLDGAARERGVKMLRCAFAIVAFMYGFPSVFYGDEAGAEGYGDPFCRRPYSWGRVDGSLLSFFSAAMKLRRERAVFCDGFFEVVSARDSCFIFKRYNKEEKLFVCVTGAVGRELDFARPVSLLLSSDDCGVKGAGRHFDLLPYSAGVFEEV